MPVGTSGETLKSSVLEHSAPSRLIYFDLYQFGCFFDGLQMRSRLEHNCIKGSALLLFQLSCLLSFQFLYPSFIGSHRELKDEFLFRWKLFALQLAAPLATNTRPYASGINTRNKLRFGVCRIKPQPKLDYGVLTTRRRKHITKHRHNDNIG